MNKPFRPPLLSRRTNSLEPPQKKIRLSNEEVNDGIRSALSTIANSAPETDATEYGGIETFYAVLWRKPSAKKHKTWDGDGVLSVANGYATLNDISGRDMGRISFKLPLFPGATLSVGGKEVEVDSLISKADYLSAKPTSHSEPPKPAASSSQVSTQKPYQASSMGVTNSQISRNGTATPLLGRQRSSGIMAGPVLPLSRRPLAQFKPPFAANKPKLQPTVPQGQPIPRHDPSALGALVMKRPPETRGRQIVDVVVDPLLSKHLRPHQRAGVKFLYECVMGMRSSEGLGAILADEMGLGKTLQTIVLIWTLLKQNPVYGDSPVAKKVLVVCPKTLENNWRKEFRKWLGQDRLGIFVFHDKNSRISDFTRGKAYSVMVVSYEKLRNVQEDLRKGTGIDLIIIDEGHRLKTAKNKSGHAIKSLGTDRIVILSGTIIQNDMTEFYYGVDIVNSGCLGKLNAFKKEFANPIVQGRQPEASNDDREMGEARLQELMERCSHFVLRRTVDVIAHFLPPKTETIVFVRPTSVQATLYKSVLDSPIYGAVLGSSEARLQLITVLKKLCNSPSLLTSTSIEEGNSNENIKALLKSVPSKFTTVGPGSSAKLQVLDSLLHELRETTNEKIVIVSNYTSTLDLIQRLVTALSYPFLRLDGSTAAGKRQGLVDTFNRTPASKNFVFLLSAKAGGVGLNLIGASRLVLFDVDWNPATDLQAMSRIHRDGQKRPCYIYRFVVQGTLEEKIYQRQVTKVGLSDAVVDSKKTVQGFTTQELRDLFRLDQGEACPTHELLGCSCDGDGNGEVLPEHDTTLKWGKTMDDPAADDSSAPDDEGEEPEIGTLIKASEVDMEKQERKLRGKCGKSRKDNRNFALMQYLHLDADKVRSGELNSLVEDQVFLKVLEDVSHVRFLFARTTG